MSSPKIVIVGGGVSGLSAGIYAQKAGFDSVVYEKNPVPGGQCIGWMRESHYIDNCICWMTCAKEGYSLWDLWKDSGICPEGHEIHQHDYFYKSELDGQTLHLWRDLDKAQKEMLELSPQDSKEIKKFFKHVKLSQCLEVPSVKPLDMMNLFDFMALGLKMRNMIPVLANYSKLSVGDLASRFKHPLIKKVMTDYMQPEYLAHLFVTAYGTISSGGGGVPVGGSFAAMQRMAKRYKELGGTLLCGKTVSKVLMESDANGKTISKGIELDDGTKIDADYVICATDAHHTFEQLIDEKYMPKALRHAYDDRENNPLASAFHAAFSFDGTTTEIGGRTFFDCKGFELAGRTITRMNIKNYSFENAPAPKGKSVLQVKLLETEEEYLYWKNLYETNKKEYEEQKLKAAKEIQKILEDKYAVLKGKLKLLDAWTPFTYTRYCNAYRGVFMSFMPTKKSKGLSNIPGVINGVDNMLLAGQWLMLPGGIPVALITGKYAIQRILKKLNRSVIINP
ncbi:phytoene desaturase family protein [Treponema sp.]|uniref:phytoene desaturase family protein n=1 Tax=Treponema sp. TaxID=166 RepID=UPI00298D6965|nr:FAD-dependent oxidoreductase [Treponema sp.]MCR5614103.1 FAD-dependent oxidoreductase [Treponema sp.]